MNLTADIHMDKNAVYYRIKKSGPFLKWLAEHISWDNRMLEPEPAWLAGRNVVAVDASDISLKGSTGSDYRLHYAFDLFQFERREIHLTSITEGEKLTNFSIKAADIILGDRIYCTQKGIEYVRASGGDFVLRYRANSFQLYDSWVKRWIY